MRLPPEVASGQKELDRLDYALTIGPTGRVTDVKLYYDNASPAIAAEARRLLLAMPAWKPGRLGRLPVAVHPPCVPLRFLSPQHIYQPGEVLTEYRGGTPAQNDFLLRTLRLPPEVLTGPVRGAVTITAVVERDGRLTNLAVVKPVSPACNAEALRVVGLMPAWRPASLEDETLVRSRVYIKVPFDPRIQQGQER